MFVEIIITVGFILLFLFVYTLFDLLAFVPGKIKFCYCNSKKCFLFNSNYVL